MNRRSLLLTAIGSALVGLGAGEIFARTYRGLQLGHPMLYVTDPGIEYFLKPNQDGWRFGNRYHINQWGMRSPDMEKAKSDKTEVRVLLFGDSVPNGGALTDQDSLATTLASRFLSETTKHPTLVANISAGSWGPPNQLAYLRKFGTFEASQAIILLSSHDYADWPTFTPLDPNTHPRKNPFCALSEAVFRYLPRYLPTFGGAKEKPPEDYNIDQTKVQQTLDSLTAMIDLLRSKGIQVTLIHHWEKHELLEKKAMVGRHLIQERAERAGIPFFTDSAAFAESLAKGVDPYRDNIHPNIQGQKLLAVLVENAILGASPPGVDPKTPR